MNKKEAHCHSLIEATAVALSGDAVSFMLIAVQKDNLRLSVNLTLKWSVLQFKRTEWESHRAIQGLFKWWV